MTKEDATDMLLALERDVSADARALIPLVYDESHAVARRAMARERAGHTLEPTDLIQEAMARLVDTTRVGWNGRAHFRATAARCMRNILVDHARRRLAERHGGGRPAVRLTSVDLAGREAPVDVLEIHDALESLAGAHARAAEIVELRFFGGLTEPETAHALGISERTARREWTTARAWLRSRLHQQPDA